MAEYKVTVKESSKELSAKERIAIKDTTNAIKLDEATQEANLRFAPDWFAILEIHNPKADVDVYENYIIVDKAGNKYVTGSKSFWESFKDIYDEMLGEDEEYEIEVYRVESKNYKGKQFITCSIC